MRLEQERENDPVVELALTAAGEAVDDAGLEVSHIDRERTGCVIGTSKGGLRSFAQLFAARHPLTESSGAGSDSNLWMQYLPNAAAAAVAQSLGLHGPALCPVAACATGLISLQRGADLIRDGYCDVVLAGSTDASLQEAVLGSFARLGVLARGFNDPATACRPFDQSRSGFVVGEGAAVLVMERMSHAERRRAQPSAEWLAGASAADPSGLTGMDREAGGLTRLLQDVLKRAGVTAEQIDYVNLHGSATRLNDRCETRAIRRVFGPAAETLSCSSLKGAIGHLLGAAGSVETAATLLALRDGIVPPTVNLLEPDPECDLNYTPGEPLSRPIEHALKLSMGFGGHLAAAVVRRVGGTP